MGDPAGARRRKRRDFWLAYGGWFVVNAAALAAIYVLNLLTPASLGGVAALAFGLLLLANVAALVVFAFTRPMWALGSVTAMGTVFFFAAVEGVFFTAGDFVGSIASSGGYNFLTAGYVALGIGFVACLISAVLILRAIHRAIK